MTKAKQIIEQLKTVEESKVIVEAAVPFQAKELEKAVNAVFKKLDVTSFDKFSDINPRHTVSDVFSALLKDLTKEGLTSYKSNRLDRLYDLLPILQFIDSLETELDKVGRIASNEKDYEVVIGKLKDKIAKSLNKL